MAVSANRLELLQIADAVAREKSIEREIVIEAIEEAITSRGMPWRPMAASSTAVPVTLTSA